MPPSNAQSLVGGGLTGLFHRTTIPLTLLLLATLLISLKIGELELTMAVLEVEMMAVKLKLLTTGLISRTL